jgi:hypothetical protein
MAFVTLTNSGYTEFTLNCLESLKRIGFSIPLHCYCIGKQGFDTLVSKGYSCTLIDDEQNSNLQSFRTGNWSNITHQKFKIIHENLLKYPFVCFTDGDIVYQSGAFYNYLFQNIGNNDMLIQNEGMENSDISHLCTGFMFIRSNEKTRSIFDPASSEQFKNIVGWDDQVYINTVRNELKIGILPLDLFPNGRYYYKNFPVKKLSFIKRSEPYLIHFNWIVGGHAKKQQMIYFDRWFM